MPTGSVTFFADETSTGTVALAKSGGSDSARLVLPSRPVGAHQVMAVFSGDANFATSTSTPVTETVATPGGDGPQVTSLARFGFHAQPTILVLTFDGPLDAASASDTANYRVVGPVSRRGKGGRVDEVLNAVYDAANNTVTPSRRHRLNDHYHDRLTVIGTAPSGVSGPTGVLLDGAGNGQPGSDFKVVFGRSILAGPASIAGTTVGAASRQSAPLRFARG